MRLIAFTLMLLACAIAAPATIYKWVDENGVTHYSDQPYPGAKKIEVESVQTYSAPPPPASQPAMRAGAAQEGPVYKACELYRPTPEEVLFNTSTVTAKLRLDPQLRVGDKVTIALDGKRLTDIPAAGDEFTVTPVFRGTHSILAVVEDFAGKIVCQSPGVTFHVRQASTRAPQSPTTPKPPPPRAPRPPTRP